MAKVSLQVLFWLTANDYLHDFLSTRKILIKIFPDQKTNTQSRLDKSAIGKRELFAISNMATSKTLTAVSITLKYCPI